MKRKLSTWLLTSFLLLSSLVLIQPTLAAPVMADDTILSSQGDHLQSFAAREYILYLVTEEGNLLATGNQSYNALLENNANYSGANTVSPFDMPSWDGTKKLPSQPYLKTLGCQHQATPSMPNGTM